MMSPDELEARIAVAHLLARYQYLADSGQVKLLSELFAVDGVFETNNDSYIGPEGVLGFFASVKGAFIAAGFTPARHYLSTVYVEPGSEGTATTYACFQFVGTRGLDHWGTYTDEVVTVDGERRFARRRAIVEGCVPGSPVESLLGITSKISP
ncbi:nuclear transport factor 2 family protein [Mycolicibacter senuensis]|uniref:nuclear transport factor 2 family protein n=1 Tax=Mycolicibacter senuensis TaxID=386913 RepID=UPI002571259A|nr:nuclear transport factor 2 family protein [Mycolicibacter senuensis]